MGTVVGRSAGKAGELGGYSGADNSRSREAEGNGSRAWRGNHVGTGIEQLSALWEKVILVSVGKHSQIDKVVAQKNLELHEFFLRIVMKDPQQFNPELEGVELVLLPDDDRALAAINAKIAATLKEEGLPVVCVQVSRKQETATILSPEEQKDVISKLLKRFS